MEGINLIQVLLVFSALLGLLWAYHLVTHKRGNLLANRMLSILIIFLAALILRQVSFGPSLAAFKSFLYFLCNGLIFLVGPAIYFYVRILTGHSIKPKQLWKHFLPAMITSVFLVTIFLLRINYSEINDKMLLKYALLTFIGLQISHLMVYIYLSRKTVALFEQKTEHYQSSMTVINLKWIRQLMVIATVFLLAILSMYILIISGGYYEINNSADTLFLILMSLIILTIAIKSWKQPEIVSGIYEEQDKYKTSPLTNAESGRLKERLGTLITSEKIYLQPEINLSKLSQKLYTKPYLLSQLINQEYGQNFFNFINELRIEFASDKIQTGYLDKNTVLGLAYECGFNSQSTFNRAFKKKMGCGVKEYSKSIQKQVH